jgi:hypothetical protein
MTEMEIQQRITDIINEYSQLKQFDDCDLTLEVMDQQGNIKVSIASLKRPNDWAERVITPTESLDFITDTFNYPNTYSVRSKDIVPKSVKLAYINSWGDLVVLHDDSEEIFKIKSTNKIEAEKELTLKLGSKFKSR